METVTQPNWQWECEQHYGTADISKLGALAKLHNITAPGYDRHDFFHALNQAFKIGYQFAKAKYTITEDERIASNLKG